MDANDKPGKAQDAAGNSPLSADLPTVESPALTPGQAAGAEAATPKAQASDYKVTTAVALFKNGRTEEASAKTDSLRRLWSNFDIPPAAAAIVLLLAGAFGTLGVVQLLGPSRDTQIADSANVRDVIAQLSDDVAALKAAQDAAARTTIRLGDRIDRAERAQAEPAARLARISDALDRLERRVPVAALPPATTPAAPAPVAAASAHPGNQSDVTGSIPPSRAAAAGATKDLSRLPVIPGWVLQKVVDGTAIIHSREGMIEVGVGDKLPGGGRVEAIRRQDGRWIVVTSRGLVTPR